MKAVAAKAAIFGLILFSPIFALAEGTPYQSFKAQALDPATPGETRYNMRLGLSLLGDMLPSYVAKEECSGRLNFWSAMHGYPAEHLRRAHAGEKHGSIPFSVWQGYCGYRYSASSAQNDVEVTIFDYQSGLTVYEDHILPELVFAAEHKENVKDMLNLPGGFNTKFEGYERGVYGGHSHLFRAAAGAKLVIFEYGSTIVSVWVKSAKNADDMIRLVDAAMTGGPYRSVGQTPPPAAQKPPTVPSAAPNVAPSLEDPVATAQLPAVPEKRCDVPKDLDADWRRYSDIDDRIPESERSHEAKEYAKVYQKLRENAKTRTILAAEIEVDRLLRLELKEIKRALTANLKLNLIKAELRLLWVIYDTVAGAVSPGKNTFFAGDAILKEGVAQGSIDLGRSYVKLFTEDEVLTKVGVFAKLMREFTPSDSRLAIDKETISGKFQSVGLTTGIAALESMANPTGAIDAAKELFQDATKQTIAISADITDEEIEILRTQQLKNLRIDDALQRSYRKNLERKERLTALRGEWEGLLTEAESWLEKERIRVVDEVRRSCESQ